MKVTAPAAVAPAPVTVALNVTLLPYTPALPSDDVTVVVDGKAKGVVARALIRAVPTGVPQPVHRS